MPADQTPRKTLILTRSQVDGLVTMAEVVEAVEKAGGKVSLPVKAEAAAE